MNLVGPYQLRMFCESRDLSGTIMDAQWHSKLFNKYKNHRLFQHIPKDVQLPKAHAPSTSLTLQIGGDLSAGHQLSLHRAGTDTAHAVAGLRAFPRGRPESSLVHPAKVDPSDKKIASFSALVEKTKPPGSEFSSPFLFSTTLSTCPERQRAQPPDFHIYKERVPV